MIFLDPFSPHILKAKETHVATLFPLVKDRVSALDDANPLKAFLNDLRIKRILSNLPHYLQIDHLLLLITVGISDLEWRAYIRIKRKRNLTVAETTIYKRLKPIENDINAIFKYKGGFGSKKTKYSTYNLAEALNVQTCVYCNRMYTKTVIKPHKVTRPEFDHWYPQESFPLFALSFYNLIPSCHTCNSSVKGSIQMSISNHIHPYIPQDVDMKFSYWIKDFNTYKFKIKRPAGSKEDDTIKTFKLEEIYETHQDEIHDLVRLRKLYSVSYLQKLKTLLSTTDQKVSMVELYRLAFGTHLSEKDFQKRPLSKMKYDILKELEMLSDFDT